ncbi:ABC transporter substrate-binding protein [Amycolatopsis sp. NPDC051903]|uniref:ABC transporter substrate-binding protein n=1 Tax=Amycolatopsis sp. NPDC051903 TaxID=3363936 RepID=UPI003795EB74
MLKRSGQRLACLLFAAGLGALTAACGFPPVNTEAAAVYSKFAALHGKSRHDQLVAAAKAEGQLVIYVTNTAIEKKIVPAFEKEYGIDVAVYRATTEQVRGRILQEAGAHRVLNDVVETKDSEMAILGGQGLIAPYTSDIAKTIPSEAKTDDMVGAYYIATLPIHNVRLAQPNELPRDLAGYADPKWQGKVAVDQGDFNWYEDLYTYYTKQKGMSDDDFVALMKSVAKNFRVVDGHVSNTTLLQAGDFPVFLSDFLQYVPSRAKDLSFQPALQPVTLQILGADPMKGAAHPAAALLFCDFYLTEAQKYLHDAGYIPTNPAAIRGYRPRLPEGTHFVYDDWRTLASDRGNAWQEAWSNLLKGKDPVLPR